MSCYELLKVSEYASVYDIHAAFQHLPAPTDETFRAYLLALELCAYRTHSFDVVVDQPSYEHDYNNFKNSCNTIKDLTTFK